MADDKKKDAPPPSTVKDGYQTMAEIAGFLLLLLVVTGFFVQTRAPQILSGNKNQQQTVTTNTFPSAGNIQIGSKVFSKVSVVVRNEPAGGVIGSQEKSASGTVIDGPVDLYGTRWWNINYKNAPDGWVEEQFITAQIVLFFIKNFFPALWGFIKIASLWLTIIFAVLVAYVMVKTHQLNKKEKEEEEKEKERVEHAHPQVISASSIVTTTSHPPLNLPTEEPTEEIAKDGRWLHIEQLMQSFNENDWRQAIIEADIILEEMLDKMGYEGDTIGDKLKNVEESDFGTLDKAWEAHKVRNRIAHMGSTYKLTRQEAERVIGYFRDVFEEFYFI